MKIKELKMKIEEQKEKNTKLYKSIPLPTHEDPLNKKADPILTKWREGSKILKSMIKELQELEIKEKNNTINENENKKVFVNGFGEATKREITCSTYEKSQKRNSKAILSFMGCR
jgi:hypothetical protein